MNHATLRALSPWQKRRCSSGSTGRPCRSAATREAFFSDGNTHASIRCCKDPVCAERALVKAIEQVRHSVGHSPEESLRPTAPMELEEAW